jgi:hypothetical protein
MLLLDLKYLLNTFKCCLITIFEVIFFLNEFRSAFLMDKKFGCKTECVTLPFTIDQTSLIN